MSHWMRLHALAFREALRRLAAAPMGTLAAILVLAIAICLPVIAAIALRSAGAVAASVDTDPHVNVYLALDAGEDDVKRIAQVLKANPESASVRFVSRAQALEELKSTTHLAEILATLDRNPLPHAFTVRVRTTAEERIAALREEWSKLAKVDQVTADFEWSQRLGRWVGFGGRLLALMAVTLGAAVAFIVGHLIRLQVLTHREEIEVSQLVGATGADVRRPFLYHGAMQGLLGGAAALGLAAALSAGIGFELRALTPAYATELNVLFLTPIECVWVLGGAALLGWVGAWRAVGRELRRFGTGS